MSIIDILEAHHEWDVDLDHAGGQDSVTCPCGWRELLHLHAGAQHRTHVAQVLEQHEREVKAALLEERAREFEAEAEMLYQTAYRLTGNDNIRYHAYAASRLNMAHRLSKIAKEIRK